MPYDGWVPEAGAVVPVEPASLDAQTMWTKYIRCRRPVVLDGLLDDVAWKGNQWTDMSYLRRKAGEAEVMVEPVHPKEQCFGTNMQREPMKLRELLDKLHDPEQEGQFYLTTQYEADTDDAVSVATDEGPGLDPVLPSPTHQLRDDFPLHPRLLGDLVLQQCNLWIGSGTKQRSSGLHHDFHDNLYLLLQGHKRFVLFPPSAHEHLFVRGHLTNVHPNGLLVYGDDSIRPDGLDELDAAHWRVVARAKRAAKKRRTDKGNDAYAEAKQAWQRLRQERGEGQAEEEEEDDDDEEDDDNDDDALGILDGGAESESECDMDEGEALLAALDEPPSFSRIKTHKLHAHFGIQPAIEAPPNATSDLVPAPPCSAPLVVELHAGQMLYLPASWFHEVTSWASESGPHMAFNYWMHPPDGHAKAYKDTEVWEAIRERVESL
ncbi:hypothetical protein MNAN1_002776 [Malassezia nana]|uniref:JmjC domain-containing protein n=1 Tax=Malassezia nana TaxID=180528 RepID=A0AAF0J345_9BASI|nr:hypothetical protein MNAN1_002776 [Malassezia nana]